VNPIDEILVYKLISQDEIIKVEIVGGMAAFLMKYFKNFLACFPYHFYFEKLLMLPNNLMSLP